MVSKTNKWVLNQTSPKRVIVRHEQGIPKRRGEKSTKEK